jgi:TetR/AcrR family transcriptional regulator, copper-responsive repressor
MTKATGKAPGRPCGFDRDAALDVALHLFWERGYQATSIAALTSAMGIQPPSLYAAFGDKRNLFLECVRLYGQRHEGDVRRAFVEEPTARQAIERMLQSLAAKYTDPTHPRGCLVIGALAAHAPESADVADELRALRNGFKQGLADRIQPLGHLRHQGDRSRWQVFQCRVS